MTRNATAAFALLLLLALSGCAGMPGQAWVPAWKQASSFNVPRTGAAAVVAGDVIYVIGGVDDNRFQSSTEYARIKKDGSLGPWQTGTVLNEERGFTEAVVHDGFIYVVGGGNGLHGHNLLRSVERARIEKDGSLGPWQKQNGMQVTRRCTKLVATDRKIYSFGGFGGALLDTVESAEFRPDGSLGDWKLEPEVMTMQRYVNGVKKVGGAAYVVGGHQQAGGAGITAVEWSRFDKDGALRDWKAASPLQTGRYALATASHGDYLYAGGGQTGAEYLDSIEMSKVGASGELGAWQATTPLPQARAGFSMVVYKDWIYVLGGTNRKGTLYSVGYSSLNAAGDIGFWGSQAEADVYAGMAASARAAAASAQLPEGGMVTEVLQTSAYTYLHVLKDDGSVLWVAGPKLEFPVNSRVRYSTGITKSDFHSKELNRTFPTMLFVVQMQKAE
jgi:N-acetylneuraminic acid mutarotase